MLLRSPAIQKILRIPSAVSRFWLRFRRAFFILLLLAVSGWGAWQWHQTFTIYSWTEAEKQEYKNKKAHAVRFREDSFKNIIKTLDERKAIFETGTTDEAAPRKLFWPKPEEK